MQNGPADGLVVIVAYRYGQHGAEAEHATGNRHLNKAGLEILPALLVLATGDEFPCARILI